MLLRAQTQLGNPLPSSHFSPRLSATPFLSSLPLFTPSLPSLYLYLRRGTPRKYLKNSSQSLPSSFIPSRTLRPSPLVITPLRSRTSRRPPPRVAVCQVPVSPALSHFALSTPWEREKERGKERGARDERETTIAMARFSWGRLLGWDRHPPHDHRQWSVYESSRRRK